jgi:hypothetical protein
MNIFLSYSSEDADLAHRIAEGLRREGLNVWLAEEEIFPGDNWAEHISRALTECDAMVALITPHTGQSGNVQRDMSYALGNKAYARRLIPVLVGTETQAMRSVVPWILERFCVLQLPEPDRPEQTVREIAENLLAVA